MQKAFSMIELVFVITVIGILAVVAVPKMAPIIGDARSAKAKQTLSSVRSALSTERQKLILQGEFGKIIKLSDGASGVFTNFVYLKKDGTEATGGSVLDYDVKRCSHKGCWSTLDGKNYTYKGESDCTYTLEGNRFVDKTTGGCTELEN